MATRSSLGCPPPSRKPFSYDLLDTVTFSGLYLSFSAPRDVFVAPMDVFAGPMDVFVAPIDVFVAPRMVFCSKDIMLFFFVADAAENNERLFLTRLFKLVQHLRISTSYQG